MADDLFRKRENTLSQPKGIYQCEQRESLKLFADTWLNNHRKTINMFCIYLNPEQKHLSLPNKNLHNTQPDA